MNGLLAVIAILFSVLSLPEAASGSERFGAKVIPLNVEHKYVAYDTFLPEFVENIVVTQEYAAFVGSRTVWIKQQNKQLAPLSKLVRLPAGFDWYIGACAIGERLLISVGNYSEERRQKDLATGRGGYIEGPRPAGILVVQFKPAKAALANSIRVVNRRERSDAQPEPDTIAPGFQSCFFDGTGLYVGQYGYLARLDLDSMSAELLELDEMMISRLSIWKENSTLWYAADEGGMGGSWIEKLDIRDQMPKSLLSYSIMNDSFTLPDAVLRSRGRLLTSSLAGVVEIDESRKEFVQYQLTKDPKTMRVYKLSLIQGHVWGLREDGWVQFDLDKRSATHYHLKGDPAFNNIYSIGYFEGQWFVGTKTRVVRIQGEEK